MKEPKKQTKYSWYEIKHKRRDRKRPMTAREREREIKYCHYYLSPKF